MAEFHPANKQDVIKYWKGMLGNPREHDSPDTVYLKCNVKGGTETRNMGTISRGKSIFIPVNPVSITELEAPKEPIDQLKVHAEDDENSASKASFKIDDDEFDILKNEEYRKEYRVRTNEFDTPSCKAVANGYYAMIKPLPVGKHKISFKGRVEKGFSENGPWEQDVTYEFEVK